MRFSGICLITHNVPLLRHFYCDLLDVEAEGDDGHVTLATEGTDFSIVSTQCMEQLVPGRLGEVQHGGSTLEFEVADVDREYQRLLLLAIPIVKSPAIHPWGRRSVWFRDPVGNLVSFYTPLSTQQWHKSLRNGQAANNKALVQHYFERLLNERDLSVCDELLAADYYDHDAPPEMPLGPQGTKAYVANLLAAYPNLHVDIDKIIAEGNRVAIRLVWRGNQAETGEPYHRISVIMVRLNEQGQLAEQWSTYMVL